MWSSKESLRLAVMPAAALRHVLYGSCTEDVAAWAIARQCPQPVSPLSVAVSIPPGALNGINRYYVLCTRDRAIPPPLQRRMVAENMCADAIELDTDHTPQLSMTNELPRLSTDLPRTHLQAPEGSQIGKIVLTLGEDNYDTRIRFVERPCAGRALWKTQGCYRHRCVERDRPRGGKKAVACGYRVVANSRNITSANSLDGTGDLKLVDGDIGIRETAQRVVDTASKALGE